MTKAQQRLAEQAREARNKKIMHYVSIGLLAIVATVAGYVSFGHIVWTSVHYGASHDVAHLMPIIIDAMMIIEAIVIIVETRKGPTMAKAGFALSMVASLGCNILAASVHPSPVGYALAALPSASVIWCSHGLLRLLAPGKVRRYVPMSRRIRKAVEARSARRSLAPYQAAHRVAELVSR